MRSHRRIVATAVAAAMGLVFAATPALAVGSGTTAAEAPQLKGPRPVTQLLPAVDAGAPEWVRVRWRTDRRVCDVRVVIWGNDDVAIDYPQGRDFTSFSRGDVLGRGKTDYTAFRVRADYDRDAFALLAATISYTDCTRDTRTFSSDTGLMLPVRS